jgi:hypothetical protein
MAEITQTIPEFPGDAPDKDTMTPDEFDVAAEAWVAHLADVISALNTWAQQANAIGVSANDLITALASANFAGQWADLTGALDMPASVYHDDQYWMLLDDLLDVTASEPGPTNTDWALFTLTNEVVEVTEADHETAVTDTQMRRGVKFTNPDAADACWLELPAPVAGYRASFYVAAAQQLGFYCTGYDFRWGGNTIGGSVWNAIYSSAVGVFVTVEAFDDTEYVVTNLQGSVTTDYSDS